MEKIIRDIRYFESNFENIGGNSLPHYCGNILPLKKEINSVGARIARKLNELKLKSENFDHIYINLSTLNSLKKIVISSRKVTPWIQYIDYPLKPQQIISKDLAYQEKLITDITFKALYKLYEKQLNKIQLIKGVKEKLKKYGSEIEITSFQKSTKSYFIKISYQINPNYEKHSKAFIKYENLKTGQILKKHFLNLELYEDIYPLVGSVSIKENKIIIKPKKSFKANLYTESYQTPIKIEINKNAT